MAYIKVGRENSDVVKLYYEDHGRGRPVVLIHGFPLSGAAWEKQIPLLIKAGYRTITYDRRGFGNSSHTAKGYDYDTFASDLNRIMTELNLFDTVLVGHSMGTGEVVRYLSTYGSARVSKAVLISVIPPSLLKTPDNPEGVDQSVFDDMMQSIKMDRFAYQTSFLNNFFNYDETQGKQVSEEVYRANWNLAVSASPIGTLACIKSWLTDFSGDVPRIDVPVLIIHGDADRVLPYSTAQRLQPLLEGSQLVTLQGAPHALPWTNAEDINRELMKFMGDNWKDGM